MKTILIKRINRKIPLFIGMILFKAGCDLSYKMILVLDTVTYNNAFSFVKYIIGVFWCIILFAGIPHERKDKISTFMLYLVFLMQIVPVTTIYSFGDGNTIYYNVLCASYLFCEIVVIKLKSNYSICIPHIYLIAKIMVITFVISLIALIIYIYLKNGFPTLVALNIYDVYTLRSSGIFQMNKYWNYVLQWQMQAIVPFLISKKMNEKKYISVIILLSIVFIVYLWTGRKAYLFYMPVIIMCCLWAKRKNFYNEIFLCGTIGFFFLVILACWSPVLNHFFRQVYSLFGRRAMLDTANTKFTYYDYFSKNPKMGLGGVFPRWLINIHNYYEDIPYTYVISEIYYNAPNMNSNTGFFAEGYMRFGHIGTIIVLLIFAWLLRMMDNLQSKCNYEVIIGTFVYPVIGLADGHIIDAIVLGVWTPLVFILLFYSKYRNTRIVWSKGR